jgi:hypothetical protein
MCGWPGLTEMLPYGGSGDADEGPFRLLGRWAPFTRPAPAPTTPS